MIGTRRVSNFLCVDNQKVSDFGAVQILDFEIRNAQLILAMSILVIILRGDLRLSLTGFSKVVVF
jgi:hypothetical protein